MYQTILVPMDGSKRAENVLKHVERLAVCFDATVIFLQVLRPPSITGYAIPQPELYQQQFDDLLRDTNQYLAGLKGEFLEKKIKSKSKVVFGSVVKEILNTAEQEKADLIVICSHGRGGLARLFYGSVASGVLNQVDRPLLVIRAQNGIS